MKKKSRYLLCLIALTVLSSVVLCSGLSVSADENGFITHDPVPVYLGEYTYKGDELLNFLATNYTCIVGYSDTYNDLAGATWLSRDQYQYQYVVDSVGDNVYLTIQFPNVDGVASPAKGKYLIIRFQSTYYNNNGSPQFSIYKLKTTLYKRFTAGNGELGFNQTFYSYTIGAEAEGVYAEEVYREQIAGGLAGELVDYNFPYLNQGTLNLTNGSVVSPWLVESAPYRYLSDGTPDMGSYSSSQLDIDFNSMRDWGYLETGLLDLTLAYSNGNTYQNGAIMFAFTPMTVGVGETFEDKLLNPTPEQSQQNQDKDLAMNNAGGFLDNQSNILGGYSQFVDEGTERPNFDMAYLLNLQNIGSLAIGIDDFREGTSILFQDNAFFNIFFIIAAPPLIIGYLLYGKKG